MKLETLQEDWEDLSRFDACWAILAYSGEKFGRWDLDAFLETGIAEIDAVLTRADQLGLPKRNDRVLDFGCGVGRVLRPFARRFGEYVGVDISKNMIRVAREIHSEYPNCRFVVNSEDSLRSFPDDHFDLVHTNLVLQHLQHRSTIESYLAEFVRVLNNTGLLVFQLPSHLPPLVRLEPRRRLYGVLRRLGVPKRFLYWRLGLHPSFMRSIPEPEVIAFLGSQRCEVIHVEESKSPRYGYTSCTYYVRHR
ncbi:MAG: class I SAM-dependent methyltransferase [Myxococcota bacterium]